MKSLEETLSYLRERYGIVRPESSSAPIDPVRPQCETCNDFGFFTITSVLPDGTFTSKNRICPDCERGQALYQRQMKTRLGGSNLPPAYRDATFESFYTLDSVLLKGKRSALLATEDWALYGLVSEHRVRERLGLPITNEDRLRQHMVIYGPPSMGKTTLLASAVNALLLRGKRVLYQRLPDLLESITRSYDDTSEMNAGAIERAVTESEFLCLDEFEVAGERGGTASSNKVNIMERIIRSRLYYQRPTLITTNLTPAGVRERWGLQVSAVLDREAHWIPVAGAPLSDIRSNWDVE